MKTKYVKTKSHKFIKGINFKHTKCIRGKYLRDF